MLSVLSKGALYYNFQRYCPVIPWSVTYWSLASYAFLAGTVCNDRLSEEAVKVVCHEFGFGAGELTTGFGAGTGLIWLENVDCDGDEGSLSECANNGYGEHNCNHEEDVGIVCDVTNVLPIPCDDSVDYLHLGYTQPLSERTVGGLIEECVGRIWGMFCYEPFCVTLGNEIPCIQSLL